MCVQAWPGSHCIAVGDCPELCERQVPPLKMRAGNMREAFLELNKRVLLVARPLSPPILRSHDILGQLKTPPVYYQPPS